MEMKEVRRDQTRNPRNQPATTVQGIDQRILVDKFHAFVPG
jgi:hypothetical protein